jgi:hypothetical protein
MQRNFRVDDHVQVTQTHEYLSEGGGEKKGRKEFYALTASKIITLM